ncbi:glycosyltransferase family 2 protein [Candidatus Omnitrophota bacterium]
MAYKGKKISVVIPSYNEEENISTVIEDFSRSFIDEIIVIDNNSTDKTNLFARESGAAVIVEKKQGYGFAIIRGLKEAKGDIVIITEADQTFQGKDMEKLLAYIEDADMVLGTRTCRELIGKGANMGFLLRWGNFFMAKLLQTLYGNIRLSDMGCTFRCIRKTALNKIIDSLQVGGSYFAPEMIIEALRANLKVIEIPVNYRHRVGKGKITSASKWNAFKVGLEMLHLILRRYLIRK